jgi:gamma-glutamylcyclotransferase (GGCT)/AIG2-like uncharacterized protein YtfP
VTFLYFAYGSNLWPPRLYGRCPSAREIGSAVLQGWTPVYSKPSVDGSAKLSIMERKDSQVHGALYEIDEAERSALDQAEPGYRPVVVEVGRRSGELSDVLTYQWTDAPVLRAPYDWYLSMVLMGARHHQLPDEYVASRLVVTAERDPLVGDICPATSDDNAALVSYLQANGYEPVATGSDDVEAVRGWALPEDKRGQP